MLGDWFLIWNLKKQHLKVLMSSRGVSKNIFLHELYRQKKEGDKRSQGKGKKLSSKTFAIKKDMKFKEINIGHNISRVDKILIEAFQLLREGNEQYVVKNKQSGVSTKCR